MAKAPLSSRRGLRLLSHPATVVLALAATYAAIDVAVLMGLPRLLWGDSGWPWLAPHWVWHPLEAARYVAEGKFFVLYQAPAPPDPAGYYYMPLGPVLFAGAVAMGDALHMAGGHGVSGARLGLLPLMVGWGAFLSAAAVSLGAFRLAGIRGAVVALAAGKAMMLGWANFDLLVAGLLVLGVSAVGAGERGVWTGAALLTKQIAGALAIPLVVSRMRSPRFLVWAIVAPAVVVLLMVVAAPRETLDAISSLRSSTSASRVLSCSECEVRLPGPLIPVSASLMASWGAWVAVALTLSWWRRAQIRADGRALLAVVTVIAVLRPLMGHVIHGSEPHHWAVAVVCAGTLAELNRHGRAASRWAIGGWGVVAASVLLRYWYQDHAMLPYDWSLDLFGERWEASGSPTNQAVLFLTVAVPCAVVFAWPAVSVMVSPSTPRQTEI